MAIPSRAVQARQARARRLGALLIDSVVYSILATIVDNVYGVTQVTSGSPPVGTGFAQYTTVTAVAWPWLVLLWLAYYIVPESLFGASLGKMLLGLCVVRVDGRPLSVGAIVVRNLIRIVDALPVLYIIGGLAVLVTGYSQRLGDRWAGTTVVTRAHALEPGATRHPMHGTGRVLAATLLAVLVFTIAFDYFGRPPLVIEGLVNTRSAFPNVVTSYALSNPQWGFGTVTYEVAAASSSGACSGTITLQWSGLGWTENQSTLNCPGLAAS